MSLVDLVVVPTLVPFSYVEWGAMLRSFLESANGGGPFWDYRECPQDVSLMQMNCEELMCIVPPEDSFEGRVFDASSQLRWVKTPKPGFFNGWLLTEGKAEGEAQGRPRLEVERVRYYLNSRARLARPTSAGANDRPYIKVLQYLRPQPELTGSLEEINRRFNEPLHYDHRFVDVCWGNDETGDGHGR